MLATLTLTRPPRRTALSPELLDALIDALEEAKGQAQTTVMIYRNATCEGEPEATVEADNVGDFQATVLVEDDTTTEFYANALNTLGVYSPCSLVAFT